MDTKWLIPLLIVAACSKPASVEEKLARLDAERRRELAGIARQQGECNAVAIEFGTASAPHVACTETLRFVADGARRTISDLDKRTAELRRIECSKNRTVTYLDC